jgi:hypothetical protein
MVRRANTIKIWRSLLSSDGHVLRQQGIYAGAQQQVKLVGLPGFEPSRGPSHYMGYVGTTGLIRSASTLGTRSVGRGRRTLSPRMRTPETSHP